MLGKIISLSSFLIAIEIAVPYWFGGRLLIQTDISGTQSSLCGQRLIGARSWHSLESTVDYNIAIQSSRCWKGTCHWWNQDTDLHFKQSNHKLQVNLTLEQSRISFNNSASRSYLPFGVADDMRTWEKVSSVSPVQRRQDFCLQFKARVSSWLSAVECITKLLEYNYRQPLTKMVNELARIQGATELFDTVLASLVKLEMQCVADFTNRLMFSDC